MDRVDQKEQLNCQVNQEDHVDLVHLELTDRSTCVIDNTNHLPLAPARPDGPGNPSIPGEPGIERPGSPIR